jgi:HSP20 family protein
MSELNVQEINAQEKTPVDTGGAETTSGGPRFIPLVDIFENEQGLVLIADMPGVAADGINVDLRENTLTIFGKVGLEQADRKQLSREFEVGDYYRQFALSEQIDQERITAVMKDGVLTLGLPKLAPAQPRKIAVVAE